MNSDDTLYRAVIRDRWTDSKTVYRSRWHDDESKVYAQAMLAMRRFDCVDYQIIIQTKDK